MAWNMVLSHSYLVSDFSYWSPRFFNMKSYLTPTIGEIRSGHQRPSQESFQQINLSFWFMLFIPGWSIARATTRVYTLQKCFIYYSEECDRNQFSWIMLWKDHKKSRTAKYFESGENPKFSMPYFYPIGLQRKSRCKIKFTLITAQFHHVKQVNTISDY